MTTDPKFSRRDIITRGAGLSVLAALGPEFVSAAKASPLKSSGSAGGTLTVAEPGDLATLDPHITTLGVYDNSMRTTVFDSLTRLGDNLKPLPGLAESWTTSADGRTVTFHLRRGVTWHDGSPFTSADVAFTVKRIQNKHLASQYAPQVATVKTVETPNPHTAVFKLSAPTPALPIQLFVVAIVSEKTIGQIKKHPIGTGPFEFVTWQVGDHISLTRNSHYWETGHPLLDALLFKIVPSPNASLADLQTGNVLVVDGLQPTQVAQVKGFSGVQLISSKPIVSYEMFQINTKKAPFTDKRVRQALSYAFDRATYVKTFWSGLASPSDNPFAQQMPAFLPGSQNMYPYDLRKAKALLAAAGFSHSKPLTMQILNPSGYPTLHSASILLQSALTSMGHKVTIQDLELAAWVNKIATHPTYDVTTDVYSTYAADPTGLFNSDNLSPGTNINRFNPPGYAHLVAAGATETNSAKRIGLYRQLQRLLLDEMPMITLDHTPTLLAASDKVAGFDPGPYGAFYNYTNVSLKS